MKQVVRREFYNAKSLRSARDVFAEIQRTFRAELNVVIPSKFATNDEDSAAANETMAHILFECYKSNLSHFSGHEREGYILAQLPRVAMHVHPSCTLTYHQMPKWIVYEQVHTVVSKLLYSNDNESVCHAHLLVCLHLAQSNFHQFSPSVASKPCIVMPPHALAAEPIRQTRQ